MVVYIEGSPGLHCENLALLYVFISVDVSASSSSLYECYIHSSVSHAPRHCLFPNAYVNEFSKMSKLVLPVIGHAESMGPRSPLYSSLS